MKSHMWLAAMWVKLQKLRDVTKPNTMNDFISAETLTALIAHMNTTVTEADFVGEDEEEESVVATSTSPIEEALGYTYDNRVQGTLQYA